MKTFGKTNKKMKICASDLSEDEARQTLRFKASSGFDSINERKRKEKYPKLAAEAEGTRNISQY